MIAKLCRIQAALKAPKNQRNDFGKYNYRSCEDILEAVKPLLSQEGLALTISDSIEMIGSRVYVKATATLTDGEKTISTTAFAREADSRKGMDESQVTGSASSYARKYALNGLFCIDDTKDADTMKPVETPKRQVTRKSKEDVLREVAEKAKQHHISGDDMKEIIKRHYNKASSKELTEQEVVDLSVNFEGYALEIVDEEALMMGEK